MARKPKLDWEAYKDQLLTLKYDEGKSLNEICTIIYEKLGVTVTAARVSQVFTGWKNQPVSNAELEQKLEKAINAN